MSTYRTITVECDGSFCDAQTEWHHDRNMSIWEVRRRIRPEGWSYRQIEGDLCPRCSEADR